MASLSTQILLVFLIAPANMGHARRHHHTLAATDKVAGDCTSMAKKGEWDVDCADSLVSGSSFKKLYCEFYTSQIPSTGAAGVSKHCAEKSDSYCLELAKAHIYYGKCLAGHNDYVGIQRAKSATGYLSTLCDLSNYSSMQMWERDVVANSNSQTALSTIKGTCMEDGPLEFCKFIKAQGTYEPACVVRIPHRDDSDDYCKCSRVGDEFIGKKTLRCNEKQDLTNEMDVWDNECLRVCSLYPLKKGPLGWICTPTQQAGHSSFGSYKGELRAFGDYEHAANIIDQVNKEIEEKKKASGKRRGY